MFNNQYERNEWNTMVEWAQMLNLTISAGFVRGDNGTDVVGYNLDVYDATEDLTIKREYRLADGQDRLTLLSDLDYILWVIEQTQPRAQGV